MERRRGIKRLVAALASAMAFVVAGGTAAAAVMGTGDGNQLSAAMEGAGSGTTLVAPPATPPDPPHANGVSDSPLAGFPTAGPSFTIMTTGEAELADDPNEDEGSGYPHGTTGNDVGFGGEANDPSRLTIPLDVPGSANCVAFDFKFLSEEYPEYVGTPFNDGFIAEIDQSTWSVTGETINAPNDFAAPIGQDRVSVNGVGPTAMSQSAAAGTTYDGATPGVTTKAQVSPGQHSLFLSVFDAGDAILDTAVFLDNLRFTQEPPQSCRPPDTFGGQTGVALGGGGEPVMDATNKSALVNLTCIAPVPCPGAITANVVGGTLEQQNQGKSALRAKRPKGKLGTASYQLGSGQSQAVPLKVTKKGKKLLKTAKKLKVKVKVTNTANGASATKKTNVKP
jgi:hypothetical protein